jgi:hypothetical protein
MVYSSDKTRGTEHDQRTVNMQELFVLLQTSKEMQQQQAWLALSSRPSLYHHDILHFHNHIAQDTEEIEMEKK